MRTQKAKFKQFFTFHLKTGGSDGTISSFIFRWSKYKSVMNIMI